MKMFRIKRSTQQAFSLIELLTVLAILGILAAVAIPSYAKYGYRARRVDAKEALMRIANAQERYFAANNRYGSLSDLGVTATSTEHRHYNLSVELSDRGFTATAAPVDIQANDVCGSFSITHTGLRLPSTGSGTGAVCW